MRNTGDWRRLADANHAILLEQIDLIRAAHCSLGDQRTLDFIDAIKDRRAIPDCGRIVMQENRSVEAGNRFADDAVVMELIEASGAISLTQRSQVHSATDTCGDR